jgi:hypothetical protein
MGKIFNKIVRTMMKWAEFIFLPIGLILWYYSGPLLRLVDPTAATYDSGIFQIILFTIIQFFIFSSIIWIYLKITFPKVYEKLEDIATGTGLSKMTPHEASKVILWIISLFMISMVLLSRVIS